MKDTTWNPGIAALLSFIIPGAGQLYKGQIFSGLILFGVVIMGYMFFIIPGLIFHIMTIFGAAYGSQKGL